MTNPHFYPEIEPFEHGELKAGARHTLYWEQCGNPNGTEKCARP
jgi:proline iminopeptidase